MTERSVKVTSAGEFREITPAGELAKPEGERIVYRLRAPNVLDRPRHRYLTRVMGGRPVNIGTLAGSRRGVRPGSISTRSRPCPRHTWPRWGFARWSYLPLRGPRGGRDHA